jgi:hypothetical protein
MKIYQGNGGGSSTRKFCKDHDVGILLCSRWRNPSGYPYYALDNGAFSAYINKRTWNEEGFLNLLKKCLAQPKLPDFVVVPDKVAKGMESQAFSLAWLDKLPKADTRYLLAVQDGMTYEAVEQVIDRFGGIFVGGTIPWKYSTAWEWSSLAHAHGKPCHIGRVGVWSRIMWASAIGADSIDSSSWPHNNSWHHITYAEEQRALPYFDGEIA